MHHWYIVSWFRGLPIFDSGYAFRLHGDCIRLDEKSEEDDFPNSKLAISGFPREPEFP